eukprot:NODE_523_length_7257_cov_0.781922.p1 type:complete len:1031 gc:universal NODE_523_length_7257_cov_0.781922:7051-3959(-)
MKSKYPNSIFRSRLDNLTSDNSLYKGFTLPSLLFEKRQSVEMEISILEPHEILKFDEAKKLSFSPIDNGGKIGRAWATSWVQLHIDVPQGWLNVSDCDVYLHIDTGCESMIYNNDGTPLQCTSENRQYFKLSDLIPSSNKLHFYVEFACNRLFGNGIHGDISPSDDNKVYTINVIEIVLVNKVIKELQTDFRFLKMLMNDLNDGEIKVKANNLAHEMLNTFIAEDKSTWAVTRSLMSSLLVGQDKLPYQHEVVAVGHCHIDTAWLWTYSQTIQKCARSWKTQCNFMRLDPEYRFVCSQSIQMEWVKRDYPEIWKEILHFVKLGQFIPIGGSVVEMDGNMPSGESFIRQVLYGQLFFESEFNQRSEIFWLPDTFGYSANLPQIIKSAGMPYFFTQKLSWNNINTFPHHSFVWRGIDNSDVIAHFCPSNTYTSDATVLDVLSSIKSNKDLHSTNKSLLLFGEGDGGGGPTTQHLSLLNRIQQCPGLPTVSTKHPIHVYQHLNDQKDKLSVWKGELYFELHRGTFTSQARNKQFNRKLESQLQLLEQLATLCHINHLYTYPSLQFVEFWKIVLVNQFHDVLPGSSIELVYIETRQQYAKLSKELDALQCKLLDLLTNDSTTYTGDVSSNSSLPRSVVNPSKSLYNPHGWTIVRNGAEIQPFGGIISTESSRSIDKAIKIFQHNTNSNLSAADVIVGDVEVVASNWSLIMNDYGEIIYYYDQDADRVVIDDFKGNVFKVYEDIPIFWDAWDIEVTALEKYKYPTNYKLELVSNNDYEIILKLTCNINESRLAQMIIMRHDSKLITYETSVDWKESHKLLKVHFTPNINSDTCTYDIQYGNIDRPTHRNTSWDIAKFECLGHQYININEHEYGCALITDCKYGYSCLFNEMGISLLRAPKGPDANCDICKHEFKYGYLPHLGNSLIPVIKESKLFNQPLIKLDKELKHNLVGLVNCIGSSGVMVDTIKMGDRNKKVVVVRLYEGCGGAGKMELQPLMEYNKMYYSNVLEDQLEVYPGGKMRFGPFEIKTILIELK